MQPLKTINVRLTPVSDTEPVKVYLLRPRGTLYWGGAGLDGGYIPLTAKAFQASGIRSFNVGLTNTATRTVLGERGMLVDAIRAGLTIRYEDNAEWVITSGMSADAAQFNLIGYSYGSLLAAQTANYYAKQGHTVDHLVLIGSPIDGTFLDKLRKLPHIRKVIVIDLTEHRDPIYAGMSQAALIAAAPTLASQMSAGTGEGHFYYAHVVPDLPRRLQKLADRVAADGVR
ncbi:thioesterase domain-containing protein [Cupriavidus sp. WKF15]|uniref:thioesterase domain-containing protein n=1 Tax=Cupriavidus sp. WKF15 TaxID=3032282 RepID=UPI0023E0CBE4|nr:thioesterase domain-containing protein [Cupriavidus sp. WKF15]WER45514.1 thioesterase domain-containing protein [Cupriavidus sp. WKF15]